MSLLADSAFLNALGWSLLNSVWQFAICWFAYRVFIAGASKLPASVKHTAALCLLFSGSLFFVFGCAWKYYTGNSPAAAAEALVFESRNWYHSWQAAGSYLDSMMPYWSLLYLGCIVLLFLKLAFFVRKAGNLHHNGVTKISARWRVYIKDVSSQLGIRKEVKALLSVHIDTPQVIGFLKPVILVPAACLTHLDTHQLEAVLLHELVHIKRNDYLVNLFMATVEILFFFNPFVKQITAAIRKEREYSCDDMVIQFQYQPRHYASALLTLEKNRLIPVTYGIAASGKNQKQLLARIERIIGIKNKPVQLYKAGIALAALLLLLLIVIVHPSPVAIDMLDSGPLALAGTSVTGTPHGVEDAGVFSNPGIVVEKNRVTVSPTRSIPQSEPSITIHFNHSSPGPKPMPNAKKNIAEMVSAVIAEDENPAMNDLLAVASKEARDYSLNQDAPAETTLAPEAVSAEEPYVPANSFSFRIVQDSSIPKIKGETYAERKARETLYNTQKALAQLNWQKIEKNVKSQPKLFAKLKKELSLQLQGLNWQQINTEVQNELQQQQTETVQEVFKQQQTLKEYQQAEGYYELLKRRLAAQEQAIKLNDQQLKSTQKAVEDKQKKLILEMKKRHIIYI
jgi:beta-lactamase regulating signal transducer with metallopeptidase domain